MTTNYTQRAVKLAIEGGWQSDWTICEHGIFDGGIGDYGGHVHDFSPALLDKEFWIALGKSMGWQEYHPAASPDEWDSSEWFEKWHYMVDRLADGGDIESYFEKLLSDNT